MHITIALSVIDKFFPTVRKLCPADYTPKFSDRYGMSKNRLALGILFAASASAAAQSVGAHPSGHGQLSVTATVVSSVGVETGPDGQPRIVVANALDPKDNVSSLQLVKEVKLTLVK